MNFVGVGRREEMGLGREAAISSVGLWSADRLPRGLRTQS